jgi:hypothetical protein
MGLKTALTGKMLIGTADFAAAQDATVQMNSGGGWKAGDYAVPGMTIAKQIDTVQIAAAHDDEDYTVTIRGIDYTIDSGAGATVGSIRDALKAAVDAGTATVTTADVGADAFSIEADVPGEGLGTAVTADTPADITISAAGLVPSALGIINLSNAEFTIRSPTAITAKVSVLVQG